MWRSPVRGEIEMATEIVFVVEEAPEGGYTARALGHSIFAEADTWDDLGQAIDDALHHHFEEDELPDLVRLDTGDLFGAEGESNP